VIDYEYIAPARLFAFLVAELFAECEHTVWCRYTPLFASGFVSAVNVNDEQARPKRQRRPKGW
jgi:hypothetical protein